MICFDLIFVCFESFVSGMFSELRESIFSFAPVSPDLNRDISQFVLEDKIFLLCAVATKSPFFSLQFSSIFSPALFSFHTSLFQEDVWLGAIHKFLLIPGVN